MDPVSAFRPNIPEKALFHEVYVDWLDDRSGYQNLLHEVLYEKVPGEVPAGDMSGEVA